nr:uncharacterized protein LOC103446811 isoform X3 [Malus domestica]
MLLPHPNHPSCSIPFIFCNTEDGCPRRPPRPRPRPQPQQLNFHAPRTSSSCGNRIKWREQYKKFKMDYCQQFSTLLRRYVLIVSSNKQFLYMNQFIYCKLLLHKLYMDSCFAANLFGSPTVRKMREEFPHVTVYKYVHTFEDDLLGMNVMFTPTFHFYQNGKKVDEIFANPYQNRTADEIPDLAMEICEKLYRLKPLNL